MRDPYEVLGVSRDADEEALTKAYRNLARQYHPDTHPDDPVAESRMKEINAAYEQIKDIRAGRAPDPTKSGAAGGAGDPFTGRTYTYTGDPFRYTYRGFYSYTPPEGEQQRRTTYTYRRPRSLFWRLLLLFVAVRFIITAMSCTANFLLGGFRGRTPQTPRQAAADISDYDPKGDIIL